MKSAVLIRTVEIDDAAKRLHEELKQYFGENIFFVMDRYGDRQMPALEVEGNALKVGYQFLRDHGFPFFGGVGWQCGDFMYYAGAEAFPDYDYYWLIENDVSFQLDVKAFFALFEARAEDMIVSGFGCKGSGWDWHKSIEKFVNGQVFGAFFPVSRISRKAALRLCHVRSEYSVHPDVMAGTWAIEKTLLYANDEAFTASMIVREGFTYASLESIAPSPFDGYFDFQYAVDPRELEFINEKVVHPVCTGNKAYSKYQNILVHEGDREKLARRMKAYCERLGEEAWAEFSGIEADMVHVRPADRLPDQKFYTDLLQNIILEEFLSHFVRLIFEEQKADFFSRAWIYEKRVAVLDFLIKDESFSFDIYLDPKDCLFKLEFLARSESGVSQLNILAHDAIDWNRRFIGAFHPHVLLSDLANDIARSVFEILDLLVVAVSET